MNTTQKRVLVVAIGVFVVALLFPPHHQDREHIFWNEYTNMQREVNYSERSWLIRPLWSELTVIESAASEGGETFEGTDIEIPAGGFIITYEFEIMKTEWFAIMGFIPLVAIGVLILFKE